MSPDQLQIGGRYNWIGQPEHLLYLGVMRYPGDRRTWHQFAKVDDEDACVWCEVLPSDLLSFESTKVAA